MSIKSLAVNTLLASTLTAVIFEAGAAVATAKVTVKVVPASSFHISKRIALSIPAENVIHTQQAHTSTNPIEISSLSNKTRVKVKTYGDKNTIYDLSISSVSTLTGSSVADKIIINDMKVRSNMASLTDDTEHDVFIEGVLTKPYSLNSGAYSGTTEITVNYN